MTDSLHINSAQSAKVHDLFLLYNQQMDKASLLPAKQKNKEQQVLMNKKDKDLKKILNKQQYQQYYRFEKEVRKRAKVTHTGPHKPM